MAMKEMLFTQPYEKVSKYLSISWEVQKIEKQQPGSHYLLQKQASSYNGNTLSEGTDTTQHDLLQ